MASYHCSAKIGAKGGAGPHSEYISREGKYSKEKGSRYEDLEAAGAGNMPAWAEENSLHFWRAADEYERANGSTYRELVVALPRELTPDQRCELVEDFIAQEIGDRHAFQWAIHTPRAALDGGEQPHAHVMYSERICDGLERDPAQYFKRANKKNPERGGCAKASGGKMPAELKAELLATRERWAAIQNAHLERHGHTTRVTHLSLKDQGIDREPERHLGPKAIKMLSPKSISALLERRAAEGEAERTQQAVGLIDLSGDIAKAKAEQQRQQTAERARAASDKWQNHQPEQKQDGYDYEAIVARAQAEFDQAQQPKPERDPVHPAEPAKAVPVSPMPDESIEPVQARYAEANRQIESLARMAQRPPPGQLNVELVELAARDAYVQAFRMREIEALGPPPEKGGFFDLKAKAYSRERADIERRAASIEREIMGTSSKAVDFRRQAVEKAKVAYSKEYGQWRDEVLAAQNKREKIRQSPQYQSDKQRLEAHRVQQRQRAEQLDRQRQPKKHGR
ncbi:MobA/MobL family protein [Alcaligenaceae bacterium]|nr:MobA/MobL family protein [Alcaligenaceae bacterium]